MPFKSNQARRDHYAKFTRNQKDIGLYRQLYTKLYRGFRGRSRHCQQQQSTSAASMSNPAPASSTPHPASSTSLDSEEEEQNEPMNQPTYSDDEDIDDLPGDELSPDDLSEDDLSQDDSSQNDFSPDDTGRSSAPISVGTYICPKFYQNLLFQKFYRYFTVIFL